MIARHDKPYKHLWHWQCEECERRGRWHATKQLAAHEFERHTCLPVAEAGECQPFRPEDAA